MSGQLSGASHSTLDGLDWPSAGHTAGVTAASWGQLAGFVGVTPTTIDPYVTHAVFGSVESRDDITIATDKYMEWVDYPGGTQRALFRAVTSGNFFCNADGQIIWQPGNSTTVAFHYDGGFDVVEQSSMSNAYAGIGRIWVKDDAPTRLRYMDDTNDDHYVALADGPYTISFVLQPITSSGGTATIDWKAGNKAKITLTEDTTFVFQSPTEACAVQIVIVQDTVVRTCSWPATVKWPGGTAPVISTGSGEIDIISLMWDGTNYYGTYGQNFS